MSDLISSKDKKIIELQQEIVQLKRKAEDSEWGIRKTNEGIKMLYAEIEKKNKELHKLDQLKSDFVSTVSHELRTPLTIVKESLAQISEGVFGDVKPEQKTLIDMALNNIERLGHIIDDLLDISKLEDGEVKLNKEDFNIVDLVREVALNFEKLIQNKSLSVKEDFPKESVTVNADRNKIIQVYNNLLSNAIKFTDKGHITVGIKDKKDSIECYVEDTGPGLQKDEIAKLFDKFQQFGRQDGPGTKGTGLGTAICKGIVQLHKGDIWAKSEEGQGLRVTFTLPYSV